jgi:hypothetical protein
MVIFKLIEEMAEFISRLTLVPPPCYNPRIDHRPDGTFFHKAKCSDVAIKREIHRVLGENIIGCSMVGKCVRMDVLSTKQTYNLIVPRSEGDFSLGDRISFVLSDEPFLSVRQIARNVMTWKSKVYRHLTHTMRWKSRHLKWIAHSLTDSEKMN